MSDFKPAFRDGIGYCTIHCPLVFPGKIIVEKGVVTSTQPQCPHTGHGLTVCIPWVRSLLDSQEAAWGIIANAYGGDWDLASEASGWKEAAERWRDAYHKGPPGEGTGQSSNIEASDEPPVPDETADVTPEAEKAFFEFFERNRSSGPGRPWTPGECKLSLNPFLPPIPDEKVQHAVEQLEAVITDEDEYGMPKDYIRTLIDAYRAEREKGIGNLELLKGTPMSADNVIYVQRRIQSSGKFAWYVWEDLASNPYPKPTSTCVGQKERASALLLAHDMAEGSQPSYGVQELPHEPPPKTQAQQDAEWLRTMPVERSVFWSPSNRKHLKEIAERLEST